MWPFTNKLKNKRLDSGNILNVKLRSDPLRKQRLRAFSLGLSSLVAAVLIGFVAWRGGQWVLNALVFENDSFGVLRLTAETDGVIPLERIRRWAGIKLGDNLYALDLARVRRDLELVPLIRQASVERVPPHDIVVRIMEREPVAQVVLPCPSGQDGKLTPVQYYLDPDGVVMLPLNGVPQEKLTRGAGDSLPLILGINPLELRAGRAVDSAKVHKALDLVNQFERSSLFGVEEMRMIDISTPEVLVVTTVQGSEITFSESSLENQLSRWRRIYDEGQRRGKAIATVDLSITNHIPVRWFEAAAVPHRTPKNTKNPRQQRKNV